MTTIVTIDMGGTGATHAAGARSALSAAHENAYAQANAAYEKANTASSTGGGGYDQANAAYTQANSARSDANTTFETVNTTFLTINTTFGTINTSLSTMNLNLSGAQAWSNIVSFAAYGQANTARSDANTTFTTINTTFATVNTTFGTINTNYQAAYAQANTARDTANDAYNNSNTKLSTSGGSISGDLSITGNLVVQGNATTINVSNLSVNDSIILLATGGTGDSTDIGFIGHIQRDSTNTHVGLIRKATENRFYLFDNYEVEPTNNVIDVAGNNFRVGNLRLGIINANSYVTSAGLDVTGQANAAYSQANTARSDANTTFATVNTTFATINTNYQAAYAQANTAGTNALNAYGQANAAYAQANSAYGAANNRVLKAGDTMTGQLNISSGGLLVTGNSNFDSGTLFVDSVNDKVGINTSTPGYRLTVAGSSGTAALSLVESGVRTWTIDAGGQSTNTLRIADITAGSARLLIDSSGNVGIGTATPGYVLSTSSSVHGQYSQHRQSSGTGVGQEMYYMFNDSSGAAVNYASIYTEIAANTAGSHTGKIALRTVTAGTLSTKLLVDQTGNVGIGTASPLSLLYLQASAPDLIVNGTDATSTYGVKIRYNGSTTHGLHLTYYPNSAVSYIDNTYQASSGTPYGDIYFRHNVAGTMTTRMTLKADGGYIGISTTTPYTYLHVNGAYASPQALIGSSGNNGIFFHAQGGATHTNWLIGQQRTISGLEITPSTAAGGTTFSTPALVILSSNQNVGVGTATPTGKLTVASTAGEVHRSIELIQAGGDTTALKVGFARFGSLDGSDYADMLNNSWWDGGQWNADNASYAGMLYRLDNATTVGNAAYRWYIASPAATHSYNEYMTLNTTGLGIGTTSPFSKLQVGSHTFSGGNGVYADSRAGITLHGALTSIMYASTYNDSTYPDYGLVFVHGPNTSNYNVWSLSPDGPAKGNSLNFIYGSNATNIHTGTPKVVFRGDGNVGIGTTNPSYRLHVGGQTFLDNSTGNALYINTTVADSTTRDGIYLYEASGQATGRQAISWYNGNQSYYKARLWTQVGSSYGVTRFSIEVANNARTVAERFYIENGNCFITGDLTVSGTLTESSSATIKENIFPINSALNSVSKLVGVTYDRKDGSAKNRAGLIAEEVDQVLPNVVNKDEEGNPTGIQYTNLIAYLVESIKELKAEIDVLKSK